MLRYLRNCKGLSLIELIVTMIIIGILAGGVMPIVRVTSNKNKEVQLRRNLRAIRAAIDEFHKECKKSTALNLPRPEVCSPNDYPKTLDILLEGADFKRTPQPVIRKFLRREIHDPFNPDPINNPVDGWGWKLRSYVDKYDSDIWGKDDVFDVYSINDGTALDGKTKYSEW